MLEMGMAAVYDDENPAQPDADMNCRAGLSECQAGCHTYIFALTKAEVEQGIVQYNRQNPILSPAMRMVLVPT